MIQVIVKRDGRQEPYMAKKVNGWGIWASKELGDKVDWGSVVLDAIGELPATCTSEELQTTLIDKCLLKKTSGYNRMAGRLYASVLLKEIHGGQYPTVKSLHEKLYSVGLMEKLPYSDEEYAKVEAIINHDLNLTYQHYQLEQLRLKYSLRDKTSNIEYETPQFVFMRMAMALSVNSKNRLHDIERYYYYFSRNIINAPTPNYVNLGTKLHGYSSCCVYDADDNLGSLSAGDHIAYMMTANSAGIGSHLHTRSITDGVRNGAIKHQGKLPYYRALVGMVEANMQNGRGGAATTFYSAYDPEIEIIQYLDNPMTPLSRQIRGLDYAMNFNTFFAKKVQKNEDIALFSYKDAPELYWSMFEKDCDNFERLYNEFLATDKPRKMVNARSIALTALQQGYETGRHYLCNVTELNRHTPFKERITGSNLCLEIALPTKPYSSVNDLYNPTPETDGEIAICSLAAIVLPNVKSDEEYAEACYYALKMIDICLHISDFPFPHLKETALSRLSAGVGLVGLAHHMARKGLHYDDVSGRNEIHEVFETHYWHLVNASLRLGKELGNAKWIDKTRWVDGWLPIDTYNKNVDELVTVENKRDWETLRKEIIANGGIRNSVLCALMPCESSSIASGTTNGVYPIREKSIVKTSGNTVTYWVAPESEELARDYDIAWNLSTEDMIKCYAVMQKWVDQTISADIWEDLSNETKVSANSMLRAFLLMVKYGVATRYYTNTKTGKEKEEVNAEIGCGSGGCTL